MSANLVVVWHSIMSMKYQDGKINLQKYCNILIDILSIEPAGYTLFSKSVLHDSSSSLPITK